MLEDKLIKKGLQFMTSNVKATSSSNQGALSQSHKLHTAAVIAEAKECFKSDPKTVEIKRTVYSYLCGCTMEVLHCLTKGIGELNNCIAA